jgi:putative transposase
MSDSLNRRVRHVSDTELLHKSKIYNSYGNALAETISGLYKAEVIHRRGPWRSFEAVELATLEWVVWFNRRRLLEPIGNIPPAEAEDRYFANLAAQAQAA